MTRLLVPQQFGQVAYVDPLIASRTFLEKLGFVRDRNLRAVSFDPEDFIGVPAA